MGEKKYIQKVMLAIWFFSLIVCHLTTAAYNVTINPRIYFSEATAVPFELWIVLIILGFVFLITALLSERYIPIMSIIAMAFFAASAYATPVVGFFNTELVSVGGDYNVIPIVSLSTQGWAMWFLWGMALISFINVWRGVVMNMDEMAKIREREEWLP